MLRSAMTIGLLAAIIFVAPVDASARSKSSRTPRRTAPGHKFATPQSKTNVFRKLNSLLPGGGSKTAKKRSHRHR